MQNQKRVINFLFLSLLVVSLFSFSIVSAGWFGDMWGKITGNVIAESENIIINGDFSNGLNGWSKGGGKPGAQSIQTVLTEGGRTFGRVMVTEPSSLNCWTTGPNPSHCNSFIQSLGMKPANISFYAKAEFRAPVGYSAKLEINSGYVQYQSKTTEGTGGWITIETPILTTSDKRYFEVRLISQSPDTNGTYTDWRNVQVIKVENITNSTCTDSDGGLNYYVGGNTTDRIRTYSDACGYAGTEDDVLTEWYCYDSPTRGLTSETELYTCPNGCVDGACVNNTTLYFVYADGMNEDKNALVNVSQLLVGYGIIPKGYEIQFRESSSVDGFNLGVPIVVVKYDDNWMIVVDVENASNIILATTINSFIMSSILEEGNPTADIKIKTADEVTHKDLIEMIKGYLHSCSSTMSLIKSPTNLTLDGRNWLLKYNKSYDYGDENYSSASWSYSSNNQYSYSWTSVTELSDQNAVEQRLNDALEYKLCDKQRVYFGNEVYQNEYQTVYVCENFWRLADDAQRVSPEDIWNYENDVVVIWFNENKLFNMEFSMNDYYTCYSSEDCQRMEQENHQREQEDLIRSMDSLLDNEGKWVNPQMDYISESFVEYFLIDCPSQVSNEGYLGSWNCKQEPIICPPHGEQKQVCTRYNEELGKEEKIETAMQCNPGICSGCYVPRWFGSLGDDKCIEYGFRFKQESGDFEWFNESYVSGGYREDIDRLYIRDIANYDEDISLVVYPNSSVALRVLDWDNNTYYLNKGDKLDLLEILNLSFYSDSILPLQLSLQLNDTYYDSSNYSDSYADFLFIEESQEQVYNYSRKLPVYFNMYCDIDGQFKQQKTQAWGECQNNYECESNLCSYGECVDLKGLSDQVTGFKGFVVKMLCRLGNLLSEDDYLQCVADNA